MTLNVSKSHVAVAVLAVVSIVGVALWLLHRSDIQAAEDRATLSATLKQQGELMKSLTSQIADRDKKAADDKASIDKEVEQAKTVAQQAQEFSKLAGLKTPLLIQEPPKSADGKVLPDAPVAQISALQLNDLLQQESACKKCAIDLAVAKSDETDLNKQVESLKTERDTAVNDAHGGSKMQRFKRSAKTLLYGALIGIAVDSLGRHGK
jgi:hypothetical protein